MAYNNKERRGEGEGKTKGSRHRPQCLLVFSSLLLSKKREKQGKGRGESLIHLPSPTIFTLVLLRNLNTAPVYPSSAEGFLVEVLLGLEQPLPALHGS